MAPPQLHHLAEGGPVRLAGLGVLLERLEHAAEGLFFPDVNTGWAVGDAGAIWFTNDGGTTWTQQPSGVAAAFNAVHVPTSEEGWAVGDAGVIVPFTMGTTATASEVAPTGFHLEPAYPNPFNPSTHLRFSLDAPGPVRFAVHDALGREVALLVDAPLTAGAHEVVFDAGRLPSGLYLARLTAGAQTQTRTLTPLR